MRNTRFRGFGGTGKKPRQRNPPISNEHLQMLGEESIGSSFSYQENELTDEEI
jgi:hypothetical protein